MSVFNEKKRSTNVVKSASIGVITNVIKVAIGFGYRTLFLKILTAEYLGVNGLFSNILQLLSLAELGVTTAIIYRFYDPIKEGDVQKVGRLMNFFQKVYMVIAAVIMVAGIALMPFMPHLINDADTVPADINLYVVYVLFLLNTVSTYLFSYKLLLLNADQRNYQFSIIETLTVFVRYFSQALVLIISRNYTMSLAIGISATIIANWGFSRWVTSQYKEVFRVKDSIDIADRRNIFKDTRACMYHKVGAVVLTGTDSAVLTKMVSLAAAGLYSNYSLIILSVQSAMSQLLGNYASSIGNARLSLEGHEYYSVYRKMLFFGLWISSLTATCIFVTVDDFIYVWLGKEYVFTAATTAALCIQYYMEVSSYINMSFINASGLFVKDRARPIIQSVVNLIVSIILARHIGIPGVFIGTIVSSLITVFWRVPYLLYRYDFKRRSTDYWIDYISFASVTVVYCGCAYIVKHILAIKTTWALLMAEAFMTVILINVIMVLCFGKRDEYQFVKAYFYNILIKIMGKLKH